MKNKFYKTRHKWFLFIIASWLITRLELAFEWSRLTLYRTIPQKKIHYIIRNIHEPPISHWRYENERFSIINYEEKNNRFIILKLQHFNKN
jgi:hypothetical protein